MRAIALAAVLLALTGCGEDPAANNHGYGWQYDLDGAHGLRLRVDPGFPLSAEAMLGEVEAIYAGVMTCTGLAAPAPFVILTDAGALGTHTTGAPINGRYRWAPPLVVVTASSGWRWGLQHEFVHHVLDHSGFPRDRNTAHDSPLFQTCTSGGIIVSHHRASAPTIRG